MKAWIVSFTLFLAVFVGCLATIFNPPKTIFEIMGIPDYSGVQSAIWKIPDQYGLAKTWTENPNYFITVGITAGISLIGACWAVYNMAKREDEETT